MNSRAGWRRTVRCVLIKICMTQSWKTREGGGGVGLREEGREGGRQQDDSGEKKRLGTDSGGKPLLRVSRSPRQASEMSKTVQKILKALFLST